MTNSATNAHSIHSPLLSMVTVGVDNGVGVADTSLPVIFVLVGATTVAIGDTPFVFVFVLGEVGEVAGGTPFLFDVVVVTVIDAPIGAKAAEIVWLPVTPLNV